MPVVTLTLKTDEGNARPREMRDAVEMLAAAGLLPSTGLKLTLATATDADAEALADLLDAALEGRSWVIEADIEIKSKRGVRRRSIERDPRGTEETPLERMIREGLPEIAGHALGVERVELSAGGRTVTLTSETRRNAERMLKEIEDAPEP